MDELEEDIELLRTALGDVEERARSLPWAKTSPWRASTHVGMDGGAVAVDLHDLSVRLAVGVVDVVEAHADELRCGAVLLITGSGRHLGGVSRLRAAVLRRCDDGAAEGRWRRLPRGPARVLLVVDEERYKASGVAPLSEGWWLVAVVLVFALLLWLGR